MKKTTRLWSLLLAVVLMLGCLTGCGGTGEASVSD